jgi:hypothetical protein
VTTIAPLYVRLENVASWHMNKARLALAAGDNTAAQRHDRIALFLFRLAHYGKARSA